MKLYISMYHYTRNLTNSRYPLLKGLDIKIFRQQLEYFKNFFNVVCMEDVINASLGYSSLPDKALLLTFDDGYIDNYTYAFPLLEEYGFQGSFFIPGKTFSAHQLLDVNKIHFILATADINVLVEELFDLMDYYRGTEYDFPSNDELFSQYAVANRFDNKETIFIKRILQTVLPEKLRNRISSELFKKYVGVTEKQLAHELYMTEEQIRVMKRHGMFIGVHGYDHCWLGMLDEAKMKVDIDKALATLGEFIDKKAWVMNYPYGSHNENVIEYTKSKGCILGLTTEPRVAEVGIDNKLLLPRLDCNDFPPKSENWRNA